GRGGASLESGHGIGGRRQGEGEGRRSMTATHEQPLTIAQAATLYPARTNASTIIRHITRGVKVRGVVVRLEGQRMGGRWTTTAEAVEWFVDRLNRQADAEPTPPKRSRAVARAEAFLDKIGM